MVSVNITTYNRASILGRCIKSVLSQSYRHIEVVVVNDGSTDDTENVVLGFAGLDPRIKYYKNNKNRGNAYTRNIAFLHSRGKYIAFMDDDDEWIDNYKLEKQVHFLKNKNWSKYGLICSNIELVDKEGNISKKIILPPKDLKAHLLISNGIIYNSTVMCRREVFEKTNGFDERFLKRVDWEFFTNCIVNNICDVYFSKEITTKYYENRTDRLTLSNSLGGIYRSMTAEYYFLRKYFRHYIRKPSLLFIRSKSLLILWLRYTSVRFGLRGVEERSPIGRFLNHFRSL